MSAPGLRVGWQQAVHIVAAGSSKSTVKGDHATTMPSREPEKIPVRDLLSGSRRANFGHRCRRYGVRPDSYSRLAAVRSRSLSAVVSGSHGTPGSCAQTRITPSSVTAQVAQPWLASAANHSIAAS